MLMRRRSVTKVVLLLVVASWPGAHAASDVKGVVDTSPTIAFRPLTAWHAPSAGEFAARGPGARLRQIVFRRRFTFHLPKSVTTCRRNPVDCVTRVVYESRLCILVVIAKPPKGFFEEEGEDGLSIRMRSLTVSREDIYPRDLGILNSI